MEGAGAGPARETEAQAEPHPVISADAGWAALPMAIIAAMFVAAIVAGVAVGPVAAAEVPPAHSHDEPPGASHHHGAEGTDDGSAGHHQGDHH
jgi:hypothetical protein